VIQRLIQRRCDDTESYYWTFFDFLAGDFSDATDAHRFRIDGFPHAEESMSSAAYVCLSQGVLTLPCLPLCKIPQV
jgi:hypothetical protein